MPLFGGGRPDVAKLKSKRDVVGLIKALDYEKDAQLRAQAATALGEMGIEQAREALRHAELNDSDQTVRDAAAQAVKRLNGNLAATERLASPGDPSLASEQQAHHIERDAPPAPTAQVQSAAGNAQDIDQLIRALNDERSDGVHRAVAAEALGKLGQIRALDPLIAALKDEYHVRRAAVKALGELGDARALGPLLGVMLDEDFFVRREAADALERLGWQPDDDTQRAALAIARRRWEEATGFGAAAVEPLRIAANNWGPSDRLLAAQALDRLGAGEDVGAAVGSLIATLKSDERMNYRLSAVKGLGELRDARAVEPFIAALHDERTEVRRAAAEALGKLGDARAIEPLIATLGDAKTEVMAAAFEVLEKFRQQAVEPLIAALSEAPASVRRKVADILGRSGDARAVEPLVGALRDAETEVRQAAVAALGKLGDARAVEPLCAALKDDQEDVVHRAAAGALGELGDTRAVGPLVGVLFGGRSLVSRAAAAALERLGWRPADDTQRAALLIARGQWDDAVRVGPAAADPLFNILEATTDVDERRALIRALAELGDVRAVPPLVATLESMDYRKIDLDPLDDDKRVMLGLLLRLVERAADRIATPDLERIAALKVQTRWLVYSKDCQTYEYHHYNYTELDTGRVRQLARQELIRRGLQA